MQRNVARMVLLASVAAVLCAGEGLSDEDAFQRWLMPRLVGRPARG